MKYADIMKMYENKFLGAWDLIDAKGRYREIHFTIDRVERQQLTREGGDKEAKPVVYLKLDGKPFRVPFVMSKRNIKSFRMTLGADEDWEGKPITIFVEDRKNFGVMSPTLSVRSKSARGEDMKRQMASQPGPSPDVSKAGERQPGED